MAAYSCVVLYGNSVFLAGLKTELERCLGLDLVTIETVDPNAIELILAHKPRVVLFDLTMVQPDFAVRLLREQPGVLLICVDPSSDEILVLSSQPQHALSIADLIKVIGQIGPTKQALSAPVHE